MGTDIHIYLHHISHSTIVIVKKAEESQGLSSELRVSIVEEKCGIKNL